MKLIFQQGSPAGGTILLALELSIGDGERKVCRAWSRETGGVWGERRQAQELRDQILCEAAGSARGTSGASRIMPPSMGPAGTVFSSAGSRDYYWRY